MQLNRSPAVYDVIVKHNSNDEEKSLRSWMENVQIILNTERTLCLLFVISRGENQKGISDIFGEMERYIYQMKALNELFLAKVTYCHPWVYTFFV